MEALVAFVVAFIFSFIGTIPPGTLNLTIIELGLANRTGAAWRFALAAAVVEYPYAWLAVEFEQLITSSADVTKNFELFTGLIMIVLGVLSLIFSNRKPDSGFAKRYHESGFRRGIILAILNPLAVPFWIAMTAYLKTYGWVELATKTQIHFYLLGVSLGSFVLLMLMAFLARGVVKYFEQNTFIRKIPGITLLLLGLYAIILYVI